MNQYETIVITAEESAQLNKLQAKRESAQAFVQQIMVAGERRNEELLTEGRELWERIAKTYNLDLAKVAYDVRDGKLVPVQVKL